MNFEVDGKQIPAVLTKADGSKWCVVLIAGSGPADIDGNYPVGGMWPGRTNILRDLASQFAALGVSCFRFSRTDNVTIDAAKAEAFKQFDHRAVQAAAACRTARDLLPSGTRIAVAGHSEGSVVGSMLCTRIPEAGVDAFISLSGPAWRFYDLMLRGAERRAVDGVMHMGPMKVPVDLYRKSVDVARNGTPVPEELDEMKFGFHTMDADSQAYLRGYDAVDPSATMARIPCPVMIVQGGADQSVAFENGEALAEARSLASSPTATAWFPALDHFYEKAGSDIVDERVTAAIVKWLEEYRG